MVDSIETSEFDQLLDRHPFEDSPDQKQPLFLRAVNESYRHHFTHCEAYRRFCERRGYTEASTFDRTEDLPYLPVQAFKEYSNLLRSVRSEKIKTTLSSSATSGRPSVVAVDKVTARRQVKALAAVMGAVLGQKRRPFLVFDANPREVGVAALGARNAAVRGFLNLAREAKYIMDLTSEGRLVPKAEVLERELEELSRKNEPVCVFGFTFVLYAYGAKPLVESNRVFKLPPGSKVIHIGGWKKLKDQSVSKEEFNNTLAGLFQINPSDVIDFYGFTEQMGVTYPDGVSGNKSVPVFSDVIVRNPVTHEVMPDGEEGLLEFVTPLPFSYPGLAILTDDVGRIEKGKCEGISSGDWRCREFVILGRAKKSEPRGCGDIMGDKIVSSQKPSAEALLKQSGSANARLLFDGERNYCPAALFDPIEPNELPPVDIGKLSQELLKRRSRLDGYSIDDLITLVHEASQDWLKSDSALFPLRTQGLQFLSSWCRGPSMRRVADRSLHGMRGLGDGPRSLDNTNRRLLFCRHRGLVGHWLAGNVPLLGMLALVQALVTRNANLLKAASSFSSVLPALLETFRGLEVTTPAGKKLYGNDLLAATAVVYYPRDDYESAAAMSSSADVRIAWGGRDAIEHVMGLPRKIWCEDLVFGPKLSFMAIGKEHLDGGRKQRRLLRRAATDASVFDQYACASPHTIFVERGGKVSPREFAELLAPEMDKALIRIPKAPPDLDTEAQIESVRLRYELTGDYWKSQSGTGWTVLYDDDDKLGLADPVYSRVIFVRAVNNIMDVPYFATEGIQTVGLAVDGERRIDFAREAALRGVDRFPDVGRMTFFDSPWDGLFPMDRLVRWISLGGPF